VKHAEYFYDPVSLLDERTSMIRDSFQEKSRVVTCHRSLPLRISDIRNPKKSTIVHIESSTFQCPYSLSSIIFFYQHYRRLSSRIRRIPSSILMILSSLIFCIIVPEMRDPASIGQFCSIFLCYFHIFLSLSNSFQLCDSFNAFFFEEKKLTD